MRTIILKSCAFSLILGVAASLIGGCGGSDEPVDEPDVYWDAQAQQCYLDDTPARINGASTEQGCAALAASVEKGSRYDFAWPGTGERAVCCDQECSVNSGGGWSCGPMVCGPCKY